MRLPASIVIIFAVILANAPTTASAAPACESVAKVEIAHAADLPKGVLEAIGAPMAEKGQPFQATDKVNNPPLPLYRFKSAEQTGCTLRIDYEHGGRGGGPETATFFSDGAAWSLIGRKFNRVP